MQTLKRFSTQRETSIWFRDTHAYMTVIPQGHQYRLFSQKRQNRRDLAAALGVRKLSGRQWVKYRKHMQRNKPLEFLPIS